MNSRQPMLPALSKKLAHLLIFSAVVFMQVGTAPLVAQEEDQRPRAVDLLPERTAVYVQLENVSQLMTDIKESNFGRMLADERIAPFVSELYGEAQAAYGDVEEDVGFSLEELTSLPTGEVCFAVITPRRKEPVFALIVDVDAESDLAQRLIDRGRELAGEDDAEFDTDDTEGVEYHVVRGNDDNEIIFYVLHEGTFLACNNEDAFVDMMARWHGTPPEKDRTLAGNRKFVTIMNKCKSTEDLPMGFSFFVDPYMLARSIAANEPAAGLFFGALSTLGLDGVNGIGGAALFNEGGYESIFHGHVLLANPRNGIFEMIALKPGFYEPEPFVPNDTVTYLTSHWDFPKFFSELEKIVDTFTSEGTFQKQIDENINQELDIDLHTDVFENLAGRVTYLAWVNDPPRLDGQLNGLAVQLRDQEKGQELLDKILAKAEEEGAGDDMPIAEEYNGVTIWSTAESIEGQQRRNRRRFRAMRAEAEGEGVPIPDEEDEGIQLELNETTPSFCFIGDHFVFTGNVDFLKHLIDTQDGDHELLADDKEFKSTMREIQSLLDGDLPSLVMYTVPARSLKLYYELLDTDNTKDFLTEQAEDNKYLTGLKRVIDENPLPPFEEIAGYFPPQGTFVVNDETGFHLLTFQRRAEVDDE